MIKSGTRVLFILKDEMVSGIVHHYIGDGLYFVQGEEKGLGYHGVKFEEMLVLDSDAKFSEPKMGVD